jgi:hypothetical protein
MRISTTVFLLIDGPSRPLRPKKWQMRVNSIFDRQFFQKK